MGRRLAVFAAAYGAVVLWGATPIVTKLAVAGATAWTSIIYLALVSSIVAYAAWYWALGRGGIGRTGLARFVQPLVGLVLAVTLLGEALSGGMVLAAALILAGVALARGRA